MFKPIVPSIIKTRSKLAQERASAKASNSDGEVKIENEDEEENSMDLEASSSEDPTDEVVCAPEEPRAKEFLTHVPIVPCTKVQLPSQTNSCSHNPTSINNSGRTTCASNTVGSCSTQKTGCYLPQQARCAITSRQHNPTTTAHTPVGSQDNNFLEKLLTEFHQQRPFVPPAPTQPSSLVHRLRCATPPVGSKFSGLPLPNSCSRFRLPTVYPPLASFRY